MTGMDLGAIMLTVSTLNTGKGFTALFEENSWPTHLGPPTKEKLLELAGKEMEDRLKATNAAFEELLSLALDSGLISVNSDRRIEFRPNQELSPEEQEAMKRVQAELAKLDTFMKIQTF